MKYNQLGFQFSRLRTESFAAIEKAYKKTGETNVVSGLSFSLDTHQHIIICNAKFSFEKKKDQPFLILEVQAHFEVDKPDFTNKIKQKDGSFLIVQGLAVHFAVLTVGAARGILHAKTEGTEFNQFLLPTIDVKEMITEDLILKADSRDVH